MIELIKAILFGIVEGITEWLPISSTGHMILLNEFVKLKVSPEFFDLFDVVIQFGAILAVIIYYFKVIWPFKKDKKETKKKFNLWGKILVACIPAGVLGIILDDFIKDDPILIASMLIIYGIIFIVLETLHVGKQKTKSLDDITYKQALSVGLFQVLALIPGTSRSGSTIIGGLITGLKRSTAVDFTFIVAIPVMFGASSLKLLKYIKDYGLAFSATEIGILLVGCIVAFIVSMLVIRTLLNYIKNHDFKIFGWYRIILGIIVFIYFVMK